MHGYEYSLWKPHGTFRTVTRAELSKENDGKVEPKFKHSKLDVSVSWVEHDDMQESKNDDAKDQHLTDSLPLSPKHGLRADQPSMESSNSS